MFRRTALVGRTLAAAIALLGFSLSALADPQASSSSPSTNLGQPVPSSQAPRPTTRPKTAPAQPPAGPSLPEPSAAPDVAPQSVPPAPSAGPAIPGLGGLMTPNGIALPGGVGFIRPGADTVGIQINTPDGPLEFTVPRRRRRGQGVDQPPPAPQATTDAPLFGQPGTAAPPAAPQASVTPLENDRSLPSEISPPNTGRPSRGSREFAHVSRLFHARNYPLVLRRLDRALTRDPGDRDLLQLRALTHLALGDFKAAYTDTITVLAQDDVWDWSTLRSLYRSADEYTALYRGLEDRVIAQPNALDLRILLAYQNLILGHRDAARRHFERVLALDPSNEVARRMVATDQPPQPRDSAQVLVPASPKPVGPMTPIPGRKRPTSSPPSGSGVSTDLGQPSPAPPAQEPGSSKSGG